MYVLCSECAQKSDKYPKEMRRIKSDIWRILFWLWLHYLLTAFLTTALPLLGLQWAKMCFLLFVRHNIRYFIRKQLNAHWLISIPPLWFAIWSSAIYSCRKKMLNVMSPCALVIFFCFLICLSTGSFIECGHTNGGATGCVPAFASCYTIVNEKTQGQVSGCKLNDDLPDWCINGVSNFLVCCFFLHSFPLPANNV